MSTSSLRSAPARARTQGRWARIRDARWSYVYLLPFVVLTLAFVVYPIVASLGYTLFRWDGIGAPSRFVGLDNFARILQDVIFWRSVRNSVVYTLVLVPVQLFLALVLALALNDPTLRFSTFYRSVYFLPAIISPAIIGVVFQLLVSSARPTLNRVFGTTLGVLADPDTALSVVIVIGIWATLGYNLVYFLAGLQTIPAELYEAARVDGANGRQMFWHITIPGLRAIGVIVVFLAIIGSLQVFDLVQVLTGGGPFFATSVVNTYIYQMAFGTSAGGGTPVTPDVGLASAASFFYGVLLLLVAAVQAAAIGRFRSRRGQRGQ